MAPVANRRKLTRRQEATIRAKVALRRRLTNKALAHRYGCSVTTIIKTTGYRRVKRDEIRAKAEKALVADQEAARRQIDAFQPMGSG